MGFLSLILFNGVFPKLGIFPLFMDKRYPIYYTIYNMTFIIVLISFYDAISVPYILAGMVIVNIMVLICWRPYGEKIHNVTIVIEQGVVLVALGIYGIESFTGVQENREAIFIIAFFVIISLLFLVIILSFIRLFKFYQYM